MISPSAIERFLEKKLDNHDWMKKLSNKDLDKFIQGMDPVPDFITKPWKHQKVCFLLGVAHPGFFFMLDMGVGKSKISLDVARYLQTANNAKKVLVLAKTRVATDEWMDEISIHRRDLRALILEGNSKTKWKQFNATRNSIDCYVTTYKGLVSMCQTKVKRKIKTDDKLIKKLTDAVDVLIIDESTDVKNKDTKISKICNKFRRRKIPLYALAGIPHDRNVQDLWRQFYLIDGGETLGKNLGIFREAFFTEKKHQFSKSKWAREYVFKEELSSTLHKRLKHRSIRYDESECTTLPKRIQKTIKISISDDTRDYYNSLVKRIQVHHGDRKVVKQSFHNLRQVTSGYIRTKDKNTGTYNEILFDNNPKMEAFIETVLKIPRGAKFVVFCEYHRTGELLLGALKKHNIPALRIYGGTKNPREVRQRFRKDKSLSGLVLNNMTGAFSLNLQVATYGLFFEGPVTATVRKQAEKRIRRSGSTAKHIFYYDFVIKNSVDMRILKLQAMGINMFNAIVKGNERLELL